MTSSLSLKIFIALILSTCVLLYTGMIAHAEENTTGSTAETSVSVEPTNTTDTGAAQQPKSPRPLPKPIKKLQEAGDRPDIHTTTTNAARDRVQENRAGLKENREEMKENRTEMKEGLQDMREKGRANAILRIKLNMIRFVRLLETVILREEKILERIQSRTDKLRAEGKDISEVTTHITTAKNEIAAAKLDLTTIKTADSSTASLTITASATPASVFGPLRNVIQSAQKHVKAAHQAILGAIKALKKMSPPKTETSTPEGNSNDN